jgi:hypothetical protein
MQDLVVLDLAEINAVWGGSFGSFMGELLLDFATGSEGIGLDPHEYNPDVRYGDATNQDRGASQDVSGVNLPNA